MIEPKHRPQEPAGGLGWRSEEGCKDWLSGRNRRSQGSRNQEEKTEKEIMGMGFMW